MAKRMTLKQKKFFGSKRQRASAKSALSRKRRHTTAKKRRAAPRKQNRPRTRVAAHRPRRKRNLGEVVYLLGNPAKRRKGMAAKRKTVRHRAGTKRNAGRRRSRRAPVMRVTHRRRRQSNPADVMGYVKAGAAVVGGAVGSKTATQLVLGASNTGIMGYFGNLVATLGLGWGAHIAFRDKLISQMVIAGGIAQIIVRVLTDQTPYGSVLANAGVGDYQTNWNFAWPQRVNPGYPPRSIAVPPGWGGAAAVPVVTHSTAGKGVGALDWN
jgi:hypothetical protein